MMKMIEKIEITMMNETVHNFRKGEFGVQNIEIDENRGFIEIEYGVQEGGEKKVLIPLQNVEKCEFMVKKAEETKSNQKTAHPNLKKNQKTDRPNLKKKQETSRSNTKKNQKTKRPDKKS